MQENIEENEKIRKAYEDITESGKSLRTIAEELGMDRKTVKRLMQENLSNEEMIKFNEALDKRNNKLKVGKRSKKSRALSSEEYKATIEGLAERGIQPEQVEVVYNRCQERKQTKVSRDTLAVKLIELLDYLQERNEGIREESYGYISNEDVIQMILKNPRIMSSDIKNNVIKKCYVITKKNDDDIEVANGKIKSNPGIFRKTIETIKDGR